MRGGGLSSQESFTLMILRGVRRLVAEEDREERRAD